MRLRERAGNLVGRLTGRGKEKRERPTTGELGWGGAKVFGGLVQEEYNPDLKGRLALQTAEKMRRTSGQVRALEQVIRLPIQSTQWAVEEPRGAGSAEREAAELLRENLFGGMERSWSDVVREACLALHFGFRVPEIVWEERRGLVAVRDLASRNPELLERWQYDERGRLVGFVYAGNRPVGKGLEDTSGSARYERVSIPIEKVVHFVYDGENGSPQGFGLWRSQYVHWHFVQAMYKILGIGIERNLLGVPVGKQGEGAQDDDRQAVLTTLKRLRAAEDAAITLPHGWGLEWFESGRNLMDAMPFLHHHNTMIAQVGLAQFLSLGQQSHGTQALAKEHTELFQMAEEGRAVWMEETLNRQLVRRWCRLNYGEGLRPPTLRHRKIAARDLGAWTGALNALVQGQFLQPGKDDEEYIRDVMELPASERHTTETRRHGEGNAEDAERDETPAVVPSPSEH